MCILFFPRVAISWILIWFFKCHYHFHYDHENEYKGRLNVVSQKFKKYNFENHYNLCNAQNLTYPCFIHVLNYYLSVLLTLTYSCFMVLFDLSMFLLPIYPYFIFDRCFTYSCFKFLFIHSFTLIYPCFNSLFILFCKFDLSMT